MNLEITRNDLKHMLPQLRRAFHKSHDLTALDLWGNLKENSPQDHGRLAGSWILRKVSLMHSVVGTNVKYALAQNYGLDPFVIYPRRRKALRFVISGKVIFAKRVNHPGIKGKKYIEKSIDQTESRIPEFVNRALMEEGL